MSNQDDLKPLMQHRMRCCERSGAWGEAKLWRSALDRIEKLESKNKKLTKSINKHNNECNSLCKPFDSGYHRYHNRRLP